ncbi:O-antigen/teichoic acid export membrane protein [Leeuwenhoekiella aestuarii]|uniref:O-antigen/teichoic acid export membrane protein n=1 Tax=Leeuwenhoekiella aestuarii TaxID=2249426 RepID=A0A4V1KPR8_9FLAO|nr:oligosaccharide flippase family protein [Leeuwenhoekiella aestuarii]RXG16352.1 O-antigen/teichoic acid export membrane protein [Leeuwenhoekiella aestuarii]RXG17045.1 O-antigen/teichoic acid export membrane protein [Leeuwenhoekiella aestuarii]
MLAIPFINYKISHQQLFMLSALLVNAGNYAYNLILGRMLGPEAFADAAILITLLLVLSFAAMTFQLGTARFVVLMNEQEQLLFLQKIKKWGTRIGFLLGACFVIFSSFFQEVFQTQSQTMFIIFGLSVPLYFIMSINRGIFQGNQDMLSLAKTYQIEMWSRLVLTVLLIVLFHKQPAVGVAIGVGLSLILAQFPKNKTQKGTGQLDAKLNKEVLNFFLITAFYEGTQILINNSDILMVKHYFDAREAGLYASLALIGRVVYFVAWMFVMILLPVVVEKKKNGEDTRKILYKYIGYISILAASVIATCFIAPQLIVTIMFGEAYLEVASLLGPYALATGMFAIANLFTYYFLSLGKYKSVFISFVGGFLQLSLIVLFHTDLIQVVFMQILSMILLLLAQILFFIKTDH